MLGAVLTGPEQIEVRTVPVPRPGPGEIVVKILAATTCGTDVKVFKRGGHPRMLKVPTLFGHEMAGEVVSLGEGQANFETGQKVVVANSAPCGVCELCERGRENLCDDLQYLNGAFAEYILVPRRFVEKNTHLLPEGLAPEKASLTEPLACVLHGIQACELGGYGATGPAEIVVFGGGPIGQLFIAALADMGHHVTLADPNDARLDMGTKLGASRALKIERGGGQAEKVRASTSTGRGAWIAIDATGVPEVWADAMESVRPGGLVNLFGGCAPGTSVPLDTHHIHYSEITMKGVYHHTPKSIAAALNLLQKPSFNAELLLTNRSNIAGVEDALRSMIAKKNLKVVISGA